MLAMWSYTLKGTSSGIQAIGKTNKVLSVMTVCRNAFHNSAMPHTCYKFMKALSTEFLWRV